MNLLTELRERMDAIPQGVYSQGLKAVLQHIEVATKHLERGRATLDETAFTDTIYRTNQAFEGSLKEAYRVLAGKDPVGVRPFEIEDYFQKNVGLRPRVLAQLKNYRQEWRNPSAHDYQLDFDEDEALLAIVTVCAFAIMLTDQITEKVAFQLARLATNPAPGSAASSSTALFTRAGDLIAQFGSQFEAGHIGNAPREVEILGALSGFLTKAAPDLSIQVEENIAAGRFMPADLVIASQTEQVIVELKRIRQPSPRIEEQAIRQVGNYIAASGITKAIILMLCSPNMRKVSRREVLSEGSKGEIAVILIQ